MGGGERSGGGALVTECATLAGVEFAAEAMLNKMREAVAEARRGAGDNRLLGDALEDVIDEGVLEEQTGFEFGNTALPHVEKGGFIELSDGATVVTLHVVGINLEHRLREGTCLFANTEISKSLLGSALLGTGLNEDLAVDEAGALSAENLLIEHVGGTAFGNVLDEDRLLNILFTVGNNGTSEGSCRTFTNEADVNVADSVARFEGNVDKVQGAFCVLLNVKLQLVLRACGHIEEKRRIERGALL